jgi:hypothetical protein
MTNWEQKRIIFQDNIIIKMALEVDTARAIFSPASELLNYFFRAGEMI